jgi:hypothetical protein
MDCLDIGGDRADAHHNIILIYEYMNKIYKFSVKHFVILLFLLIIVFFVYRHSIKEGQTTESDSVDDTAADDTAADAADDSAGSSGATNTGCNPVSNVSENQNDREVGKIISNHIKDANSVIDSYYKQLQAIQKKFSNISTCLSIGTVDVSSENSIPVITIDDPISGTINQKINFILPKGQRGDKGQVGPAKGAEGIFGHKGVNGTRGPVGENIIPNNIYNKVY